MVSPRNYHGVRKQADLDPSAYLLNIHANDHLPDMEIQPLMSLPALPEVDNTTASDVWNIGQVTLLWDRLDCYDDKQLEAAWVSDASPLLDDFHGCRRLRFVHR